MSEDVAREILRRHDVIAEDVPSFRIRRRPDRIEPTACAEVGVMSWDRPFEDPVVAPDGKPLKTLRDAAKYIQKPNRTGRRQAEC